MTEIPTYISDMIMEFTFDIVTRKKRFLEYLNGPLKEIEIVNRIGKHRAEIIFCYREVFGNFDEIEQLRKVFPRWTDSTWENFLKVNYIHTETLIREFYKSEIVPELAERGIRAEFADSVKKVAETLWIMS